MYVSQSISRRHRYKVLIKILINIEILDEHALFHILAIHLSNVPETANFFYIKCGAGI